MPPKSTQAPVLICTLIAIATLFACTTALAFQPDGRSRALTAALACSAPELAQALLLKKAWSKGFHMDPSAYPRYRPAPAPPHGDPSSAKTRQNSPSDTLAAT